MGAEPVFNGVEISVISPLAGSSHRTLGLAQPWMVSQLAPLVNSIQKSSSLFEYGSLQYPFS